MNLLSSSLFQRIYWILVLIVAALPHFLFSYNAKSEKIEKEFSALAEKVEYLAIGKEAPNVESVDLQGNTIHLDSLFEQKPNQIIFLNFWATWCPPCITEMPSLQAFAKKMDGKGVSVIAVSVDEEKEVITKTFPDVSPIQILWDPSSASAQLYGTTKYPESYLLKDGKILGQFIGPRDWMSKDIEKFFSLLLK